MWGTLRLVGERSSGASVPLFLVELNNGAVLAMYHYSHTDNRDKINHVSYLNRKKVEDEIQ